MSQSERPQSDANRIAIDNLPPSFRPRRWARVAGATAADGARFPDMLVALEPDPDLDDQIEAAGEQPAP